MSAKWLAIILLFVTCTATGAELGRLFFTPDQRAKLDDARRRNLRIDFGNEGEPAATPAPPVAQHFSVNGVVRRNDGKSTVWINNRPVGEPSADGVSVSAGRDNRIRLTVPDSGRSLDLKVGQTAEVVSGTIAESFAKRPATGAEAKPPTADTTTTAAADKGPAAPQGKPALPQRQRAGRTDRDTDRPDDAANNNTGEPPPK